MASIHNHGTVAIISTEQLASLSSHQGENEKEDVAAQFKTLESVAG